MVHLGAFHRGSKLRHRMRRASDSGKAQKAEWHACGHRIAVLSWHCYGHDESQERRSFVGRLISAVVSLLLKLSLLDT